MSGSAARAGIFGLCGQFPYGTMEPMETIDYLQGFASPLLDVSAQAISDLGSEQGYIALLLAVYLGFDASIGRRVGVYLLLAFTLNFHLKELFGTVRPFHERPEILRSTEEDLGPGFPSGHAQAATAFWGYLALRVRRWWFWAIAILVMLLIALTRLYLGVHVPVDVLGGILIGAAVVAAASGLDRAVARVDVPGWATAVAGIGLPLATNVWVPPPGDDSGLLMGGLAAFLTAPLVWRHRVPAEAWRRILLVVLGILLTLTLLTVTSLWLPEDVKRDAVGGFLRYLALGYIGLVFAPWMGGMLGLRRRELLERG